MEKEREVQQKKEPKEDEEDPERERKEPKVHKVKVIRLKGLRKQKGESLGSVEVEANEAEEYIPLENFEANFNPDLTLKMKLKKRTQRYGEKTKKKRRYRHLKNPWD